MGNTLYLRQTRSMAKIVYTNCPLCGSAHIKKEFDIKDHSHSGELFELTSCNDCGFVFTDKVPSEDEIGPYYKSDDYISHSDTQKGLTYKLYHMARKRMLKKKERLISRLSAGKRLLDVGAGTGYFPNQMKSAGFDVVGVEVDDDTRKYASEKFDLNLHPSVDAVIEAGEKEFDFISLWHVLEHLYGKKDYMAKFSSLLKEDGHLVIAVPNSDSYDARKYKDKWAAYDVPIHLWHFTPKSMKELAKRTGFEVVKMKQLPFDPFYISILSEKYKGGSLGLIKGMFTGFISFLKGSMNVERASSVVYVLRKSSK